MISDLHECETGILSMGRLEKDTANSFHNKTGKIMDIELSGTAELYLYMELKTVQRY
jgi:hypothetical protein